MGRGHGKAPWPRAVGEAGDVKHVVLWTQVLSGLALDADGVVHELSTPAWLERRQQLEALGGPPP